MERGIAKRAVASTDMNDTSSRSHTIFKLVVESKARLVEGQTEDESAGAVLVAALNLVDLAGSESVRHTGATGQRQKEGGKINQVTSTALDRSTPSTTFRTTTSTITPLILTLTPILTLTLTLTHITRISRCCLYRASYVH